MSELRETLAALRAIHARSDWAKCPDPMLELWRMRYGDRDEWPQWLLDRYPDGEERRPGSDG